MIRAAAKNHAHVGVVTDPPTTTTVVDELRAERRVSAPTTRRRLARKAFAHTAAYDAAIVAWFDGDELLPPTLALALRADAARAALRREPAPARGALPARGRRRRGGTA